MKKLLASISIMAFVSACATNKEEVVGNREAPAPINGAISTGVTLPIITDLPREPEKRASNGGSGIKRPNKAEMQGTTWVVDYDPNSTLVIPVQTTNSTGTRPVGQVLITSDLPAGQGVCSITGVDAAPLGSAFALAFKAGAPNGVQVPCTVQFGGMNVNLILEATSKRGPTEVRIEGRKKKRAEAFPRGVCSNANFRVSRIVPGGPIGACDIVDATGANTSLYVKLPGNATSTPAVRTSDGKTMRLANFDISRLPSGEQLIRIQGAPDRAELLYQTGETVMITRGAN